MSDQPRGLRSLFGDSLVYGISVAAAPLALVLATPVLARELGPQRATASSTVLAALLSLASIVAMVGLDSAAARTWFDEPDAARRLASLRTALALVFAVSCVVAVLLVLTGVVVAEVGGSRVGTAAVVAAFGLAPARERPARGAARVPAASAAGGVPDRRPSPGCRGERRRCRAGGRWGRTVGVLRRARRRSSGVLVYSLAGSGLLRERSVARDLVSPMLRYGLPLVPAAAAAWLVFAVDRTLIVAFRGLEEAGYYGLASKVTAPMLLLVSAFGIAWPPFIFGQPSERRLALRARALTAVLAGASGLFLLVVLFADELVGLLGGGSFDPAAEAVPGIAIGWLGWAAATVLQTEFALERRTSVIAVATGIAAAANVLLNLALIPPVRVRRRGLGDGGVVPSARRDLLGLGAPSRQTPRTTFRGWPRVIAVTAAGSAALLSESLAVRASSRRPASPCSGGWPSATGRRPGSIARRDCDPRPERLPRRRGRGPRDRRRAR